MLNDKEDFPKLSEKCWSDKSYEYKYKLWVTIILVISDVTKVGSCFFYILHITHYVEKQV